jgi:segregation and condensation protein B
MSGPQPDPATAPDQEAVEAALESRDEPESVPCPEMALTARVEALLLSTDRPLAEERLADLLGLRAKGPTASVRAALDQLNREYEQTGRAFRAQRVAGGWQLLTLPALGPLISRLHQDRRESRLSQPALETLAIIAYRQPIMRAEIEAIRGVACGEVLRALLERRLVRITGRAEQLGRPMLYGTTGQFLKIFGLPGLDALPPLEGASPASGPPAPDAAEATRPADADNPTDTTMEHDR